jgi:hypothetical protein
MFVDGSRTSLSLLYLQMLQAALSMLGGWHHAP